MRTSGGQELAVRGWRPFIWMAIAAILLAPLVAMHFTPAVHWTAFDFAVAGGLLVGAMATYEIAARFVRKPAWRMTLGGALVLIVLLLWADGAVGIF